MIKSFTLLLCGMALAFPAGSAHAFAKRTGGEWAYYHFDGRAFVAGRPAAGGPFVAVRDGVAPLLLTDRAKVEAVKLPSGTGALAGICYIQASGGKLASGAGYLPCIDKVIEIRDGDRVVATAKTDVNGYFMATLPAGRYTVVVREAVEATVATGGTSLVAIRGGKRMVD